MENPVNSKANAITNRKFNPAFSESMHNTTVVAPIHKDKSSIEQTVFDAKREKYTGASSQEAPLYDTFGEATLKHVQNFVNNVGVNIINDAGDVWELFQSVNPMTPHVWDFDNEVKQYAESQRDYRGKHFNKPTDKTAFSRYSDDANYALEDFFGVFESAAAFATEAATLKAPVGLITRGIFSMVKAGSKAAKGIQAISQLSPKLARMNYAHNVDVARNAVAKGITSYTLGYLEAADSGKEVFKTTHNKEYARLIKTLSPEQADIEAKRIAEDRAVTTTAIGTAIVGTMNLSVLGLLFKTPTAKDLAKKAMSPILKRADLLPEEKLLMLNTLKTTAPKKNPWIELFLKEAPKEGVEEIGTQVSEAIGLNYNREGNILENAYASFANPRFRKAIADDLLSEKTLHNFVLGYIGGAAQTGLLHHSPFYRKPGGGLQSAFDKEQSVTDEAITTYKNTIVDDLGKSLRLNTLFDVINTETDGSEQSILNAIDNKDWDIILPKLPNEKESEYNKRKKDYANPVAIKVLINQAVQNPYIYNAVLNGTGPMLIETLEQMKSKVSSDEKMTTFLNKELALLKESLNSPSVAEDAKDTKETKVNKQQAKQNTLNRIQTIEKSLAEAASKKESAYNLSAKEYYNYSSGMDDYGMSLQRTIDNVRKANKFYDEVINEISLDINLAGTTYLDDILQNYMEIQHYASMIETLKAYNRKATSTGSRKLDESDLKNHIAALDLSQKRFDVLLKSKEVYRKSYNDSVKQQQKEEKKNAKANKAKSKYDDKNVSTHKENKKPSEPTTAKPTTDVKDTTVKPPVNNTENVKPNTDKKQQEQKKAEPVKQKPIEPKPKKRTVSDLGTYKRVNETTGTLTLNTDKGKVVVTFAINGKTYEIYSVSNNGTDYYDKDFNVATAEELEKVLEAKGFKIELPVKETINPVEIKEQVTEPEEQLSDLETLEQVGKITQNKHVYTFQVPTNKGMLVIKFSLPAGKMFVIEAILGKKNLSATDQTWDSVSSGKELLDLIDKKGYTLEPLNPINNKPNFATKAQEAALAKVKQAVQEKEKISGEVREKSEAHYYLQLAENEAVLTKVTELLTEEKEDAAATQLLLDAYIYGYKYLTEVSDSEEDTSWADVLINAIEAGNISILDNMISNWKVPKKFADKVITPLLDRPQVLSYLIMTVKSVDRTKLAQSGYQNFLNYYKDHTDLMAQLEDMYEVLNVLPEKNISENPEVFVALDLAKKTALINAFVKKLVSTGKFKFALKKINSEPETEPGKESTKQELGRQKTAQIHEFKRVLAYLYMLTVKKDPVNGHDAFANNYHIIASELRNTLYPVLIGKTASAGIPRFKDITAPAITEEFVSVIDELNADITPALVKSIPLMNEEESMKRVDSTKSRTPINTYPATVAYDGLDPKYKWNSTDEVHIEMEVSFRIDKPMEGSKEDTIVVIGHSTNESIGEIVLGTIHTEQKIQEAIDSGKREFDTSPESLASIRAIRKAILDNPNIRTKIIYKGFGHINIATGAIKKALNVSEMGLSNPTLAVYHKGKLNTGNDRELEDVLAEDYPSKTKVVLINDPRRVSGLREGITYLVQKSGQQNINGLVVFYTLIPLVNNKLQKNDVDLISKLFDSFFKQNTSIKNSGEELTQARVDGIHLNLHEIDDANSVMQYLNDLISVFMLPKNSPIKTLGDYALTKKELTYKLRVTKKYVEFTLGSQHAIAASTEEGWAFFVHDTMKPITKEERDAWRVYNLGQRQKVYDTFMSMLNKLLSENIYYRVNQKSLGKEVTGITINPVTNKLENTTYNYNDFVAKTLSREIEMVPSGNEVSPLVNQRLILDETPFSTLPKPSLNEQTPTIPEEEDLPNVTLTEEESLKFSMYIKNLQTKFSEGTLKYLHKQSSVYLDKEALLRQMSKDGTLNLVLNEPVKEPTQQQDIDTTDYDELLMQEANPEELEKNEVFALQNVLNSQYPEILMQVENRPKAPKGKKVIVGMAIPTALKIVIDATNANKTTVPHEYAHIYIAWYRNTIIVQEAIRKHGSEEALVQAIAEQSVEQKGEAYSWWEKFVAWILKRFRNLSVLNKQQLTNILTDAFLTRTNLITFESVYADWYTKSDGTMDTKDKSTEQVLTEIANMPENRLNTIARKLLEFNLQSTIITLTEDEFTKLFSKDYPAAYSYEKDTVYLREFSTIKNVVHELVHAATLTYLTNNQKAAEQLEQYLNDIKNVISDEDKQQYGLSSITELITETFTNPEFVRAMSKYKAIRNKKLNSIIQELYDMIASWLGVDNLYSEMLNISNFILDKNKGLTRATNTLEDMDISPVEDTVFAQEPITNKQISNMIASGQIEFRNENNEICNTGTTWTKA